MSFKTWFIDFLGNVKNKKGDVVENVIEEQLQEIYYKELAIQTAISLIANAISKCEIKVYEENREVKNKLYHTLNIEPNSNENSSQFWHKAIEKMIYDNECIVIEVNEQLYCADNYSIEDRPVLGNLYRNVAVGQINFNRVFKSDEVLRLKLNNSNIKKLIDGLYQQYGELLAYAAKKYKKANGSKYKLVLDKIKAGDTNFQELYETVVQKQLKTFMENENAVYPQYLGYDLQDISSKINTDSSDFRNIRKDIFEIVAQAFQIPVSLMFGNITNMNDIVNIFLTFGIDPIAEMITKETTRKYSGTYDNWKKGTYTKVDTSTIKHIDILDVAEKVDKLISSGNCCIDETRKLTGFDPLNTEFSKQHFITKNYDTVENRLKGDVKNNNEGGGIDE
ncbi:phage portal protein%2C HK97 family [uncultured Clostridium sp.]|nr:phage portal protein%2C HK97 family [uncultured Clostridium sp.]